MFNYLFGKKAPDEHRVPVIITIGCSTFATIPPQAAKLPKHWASTSELWDALSEVRWLGVVRGIESTFTTERSQELRRRCRRLSIVMWVSLAGVSAGFLLGFLLSFIGCTAGAAGVCATGLVFGAVFVLSLVLFIGVVMSQPAALSQYGQVVIEELALVLPRLAADNPGMSLELVNILPNSMKFEVKIVLRRPSGGEAGHQEEVRLPPPPSAAPAAAAHAPVPMPRSLPPYWQSQALDRGHFSLRCEVPAAVRDALQRALDSTFRQRSTRDRSGELPKRLRLLKCHRIEHSTLWSKHISAKESLRSKWPHGCTQLKQMYPQKNAANSSSNAANASDGDGHDVSTQGFVNDMSPLALDDALNEFYLWHGTSPAGALGVTDVGFRIDLSGSHAGSMFGKGAYFAEASSKADEYSHEGEGIYAGVYALLLCRVVCGQMLRLLRPNAQAVDDALAAGSADSVLGDREASVGTYREFVVFQGEHVYPEYVILYEREATVPGIVM